MKLYEFAMSKGPGTLTMHGVCKGRPPEIIGHDLIDREISQASYDAFLSRHGGAKSALLP
jgi:hypothetical protein